MTLWPFFLFVFQLLPTEKKKTSFPLLDISDEIISAGGCLFFLCACGVAAKYSSSVWNLKVLLKDSLSKKKRNKWVDKYLGHCTQTSFLNWMNFFEEWEVEFWSFATRITFGTRKIWINYSSCRPNHAGLDPECGRPGSLAAGMLIYTLLEPPLSQLIPAVTIPG